MKFKKIKDIEGVFVYYQNELKKLATINLIPGKSVYGENLIKSDDLEYRNWAINRSKLAAAIYKGLSKLPIKIGSVVLYLGVSSGTTASHISDIIGNSGRIYGVDFAERSMRDFVALCEERKNLIPILADARIPESYRMLIEEVDGIYMDVAQPQQAKILIDNALMFLKPKGWFLLCVKSQSIDVTKKPSLVFEEEKKILEINDFEVKEEINLEPFSLDHVLFYGIMK